MSLLISILQKHLSPLGVPQDVIDRIVFEAETNNVGSAFIAAVKNGERLREFKVSFNASDGQNKTIIVQACNDIAAWAQFRELHPHLIPTNIVDIE